MKDGTAPGAGAANRVAPSAKDDLFSEHNEGPGPGPDASDGAVGDFWSESSLELITDAFSLIFSLVAAIQSMTAEGVTEEESAEDGRGLRVFVFLPRIG